MRKLVFPRITRSEYVSGNIKETCFRNVFACFRKCSHKVTLAETLVSFNGNSTETYKKVVRFRCKRSDGNMSKRDVSASVNMCKPSCFRDGVTCLRNVSVCGFLLFRPVDYVWSPSFSIKTTVLSGATCLVSNGNNISSRASPTMKACQILKRDKRTGTVKFRL